MLGKSAATLNEGTSGPTVAPMPAGPLVSVFTAARDIGQDIDTAYRSLLRQSYAHWEWVVVDDSRKAATWHHLVHLTGSPEAAGRLRIYRQHPPSGSAGATKAAAAALCRGTMVVELDQDDELLPEALEVVAATFVAHPAVDFVYSDWIDWRDGRDDQGEATPCSREWGSERGAYASEVIGGRRVPVALAPPLTRETVRHLAGMPNHLRAWRTAFYRRIGGHDAGLPLADDYDLLVRTFLAGTMARIPRPLYIQHHGTRGESISRRRNGEIQRRIGQLAEVYQAPLDRRCLSLGLMPATTPLGCTSPPLAVGNARIDVIAEAAADLGTPLISVVMPTYGRPELLAQAIDSVLRQSYPNLELLVVGDRCPSVDRVVAAIDDPRLRHWNLARHYGDSGATPRNYALTAMARGTLIAYLDDDNVWRGDHLESLVGLLIAEPAAAFAFSSFELGGETIVCRRPRRYQIDTSALLHRRFLLDRFGYWVSNAEAGGAHDWDLVSRWDGEPWMASHRPTLLYRYEPARHHPNLIRIIKGVADEERRAALVAPVP